MSDTAARVRAVIAEETGREPHALGPGVRFGEDLGLDGEDVAHILREVESECDVALDADDPAEATTVGRLIRLVERHLDRLPRRSRA